MGYSACAPFPTTALVEVLRIELMVEVDLREAAMSIRGERAMKHYVGLDVSVKETAICIVDETGRISRETKVVSHPEDLSKALAEAGFRIERIGLEAGPLSQWLFEGLTRAGLPVICVETRHTKAFLKAQVNKSDRNDARGIAQMMCVNLYRPVHVKTLASQRRRALLRARNLLQEKAISIENDIRGLLRNFGLKVGVVGAAKFEARVRELADGMPELDEFIVELLAVRRTLRDGFSRLHGKVLAIAGSDTACVRLMTIPGVGGVTAPAFISTIDIPARFRNSRSVGPALGLTPVLRQSGESERVGRVSLCGDGMMRGLLYEAAQALLTRVKKWCCLKAWAASVAKRGGLKKAVVALARRLGVIMHRMWIDGSEFRWSRDSAIGI